MMVTGITFVSLTMSTISSISSASQSASASSSLQSALQQAKRNANQAETEAQTLQQQASSAQATASSAQAYASSLNIQSAQAQLTVGFTQQSLDAVQVAGQIDTEIPAALNNIINLQASKADSVAIPTTKPPVVNTSGQVTGKIINTSA